MPAPTFHERGKGCGSSGDSAAEMHICCGALAADAMPGLSMDSVVGKAGTDICAGISVSCAVEAFAAAGGIGVVAAENM